MNKLPKTVANYKAVFKKIKNLTQVISSSYHGVHHNLQPSVHKLISGEKRNAKLTSFSLQKLLIRGNLTVSSGPAYTVFVRYIYHNDMKVPDFSAYRRSAVKSPNVRSIDSMDQRRLVTYAIEALGGLFFLYGLKSHGSHYVYFLAASAEVLALAKIEINLSEIKEGQSVTFKWRGKPLFIRHRTQQQIDLERSVDISTLRDPERDEDRVKDPAWLVVIGVCTHLGCVPIADAGDYNGYYCPCHGSHFDGSGRTRKGPAPTNLEVPYYTLDTSTNLLTVG